MKIRWKPKLQPIWCVYIVRCVTPNCFYVGITTDPKKRLKQHQQGKAAPQTRVNGAMDLTVMHSGIPTRWDAEVQETIWAVQLRREGKWVRGGGYTGVSCAQDPH